MGAWLNNTATGKAIKVVIYIAVAGAVDALLAAIANKPELFVFLPVVAVGIINVILVAIRGYLNPKVKNI